jgi:LPS-assembly protein
MRRGAGVPDRAQVRARLLALLCVLVWLLGVLPGPGWAIGTAVLVADRIAIDGGGRLIAEGGVEVTLEGWQLRARRIVYDPAPAELAIEGPLELRDSAGAIVVVAEAGMLSDSLRDGLVRGAQMVLNQRMRISADMLTRRGGHLTEMRPAAASSCRVCRPGAPPLWEIRASRVQHDARTRQIDFVNAQLRVAGVPVLWLPRLRLPDPSLRRARGFLAPELRSTTALGLGIEAPYFVPLGESRDLTLRPFLGVGGTFVLGLRYRQAFETGQIEITGVAGLGTDSAVSDAAGGLRGALTARGAFGLPRGYGLSFSATGITDRSALSDFGLSDSDRVESDLRIGRIRRAELVQARLVRRASLRDSTLDFGRAAFILDGQWQRRIELPRGWGSAQMGLEGYGIRRERDEKDAVLSGLGRLTASGGWRAERVLASGVVVAAETEVHADFYSVLPEGGGSFAATRLAPSGALALSWPQIRVWQGPGGTAGHDLLEPKVQIVGGRLGTTAVVGNADSPTPELDEGNLFAFSRYVGADRREAGPRANLGLSWSRHGPEGSVRRLAVGRVLRASGPEDHGGVAGEPPIRAEWLVTGALAGWRGFDVAARAVLEKDRSVERADLRIDYGSGKLGLETLWLWTRGDPAAAEPLQQVDISELGTRLRLGLGPHLMATGTARFDLSAGEPTEAGLMLVYLNECLKVDLSLSRQLSTSTTVGSNTEFGLRVELLGFGGTSEVVGPTRRCRQNG